MTQMNIKYRQKGFSLIELIVVILIMAILAVSLTPQVMKWVDRAHRSSDLDYMHSLESAISYALMDQDVLAEVNATVVDAPEGHLVLTVNSIGTSDPAGDGSSVLLQKTAETLGIDTSTLMAHKISASGGVINIYINGGKAIGQYNLDVDFANE